jgi:hypothetical protein
MPWREGGYEVRQCPVCDEEFRQVKPGQVFCSRTCSNKIPRKTGGVRLKTGLEVRTCRQCGNSFQPSREKQRWCSLDCYYQSEEWAQSRELQNSNRRVGNHPDPEVRRALNFRYNLMKYKMTPAEYESKLAAQNGVCVICGKPPRKNGERAAARLHVDHDHATGRNRDLICNNCNRGLGYFRDDPALMRVAAEYIERHRLADERTG